MDFKPGEKHSVAFRYGETPWINWAKVVWGMNAAEPSNEWPSSRVSRNWGADWTYTINPAMVISLRAGLARYEGFSGNTFAGGFDPRTLGFPDRLVSQFTALQFPRFNMGTYTEAGASTVTSYETHDNWSATPVLNWISGRHIVKIGGDLRRYNRNQLQPGLASGSYDFSKLWTQANPQQADAGSGNEFATFLLGYPTGGTVARNIDPAYRNHYYSVFVQDDVKLWRNFTLNLGLRWDYETPARERFDRMVRTFDRNVKSPIDEQVKELELYGGLVYAGVNGASDYAFEPKRMNFQPRIGVAWSFLPRWVLRGGYGMSVLGQSAFGAQTGFSQPTPLVASTDGNLTPAATLSDPFPAAIYPGGLLQPIGSSQGLATNLGQAVSGQYLDRRLPVSHQFSLGFQRELPGAMVADVSYVGNMTRRLPVSLGMNFLSRAELERLPVADRAAYFNTRVSNPMAGLLPNSGINGATVPRSRFVQVSAVHAGDGHRRTGGQAALPLAAEPADAAVCGRIHAARRLHVVEDARAGEPAERAGRGRVEPAERGAREAAGAVRHSAQVHAAGHLRASVRQRQGGGIEANALLNGLIGGWNLSAQYALQTGFPMDFPNNGNLEARSAKLSDEQRRKQAEGNGRKYWDVSYDKWFDVTLFPRSAQPAFTLRSFSTRFPDVRAQGVKSAEISIYKQFTITERVRWQIRADAYNAFNHPWFGQPATTNVTDSRFGQLNADMNNETRIIALVMKIVF